MALILKNVNIADIILFQQVGQIRNIAIEFMLAKPKLAMKLEQLKPTRKVGKKILFIRSIPLHTKKYHSRVRNGKMTKNDFFIWSENARELRDEYIKLQDKFVEFKRKLDKIPIK